MSIRHESGNASLILVACVLFVMIFFLGLSDIGIFLLARSKAQTAADAAALAAASELVPGRSSANQQASVFAGMNGARLVRCDCRRGKRIATVEVEIPTRFILVRAAGIEAVSAKASAEPDVGILPD